jgi:ribonucleoside-diphosphate reductase beta chain
MDNNWLPTTVPMLKDKQTWQRSPDDPEGLTLDERHVVLTNLSFFSPSESLIGNHIGLALMKYINDPGARQALWRLGFEESIHNETFMYIVESLGLNEKEIYSAYHTVPVIQAKTSFMQEATESLANERIDTNTIEGKRTFIEALLAQMIMEGILFYSGFVMILNLHKQNKMTGIGKQYAYIMRDESVHIEIVRTIFNILTKEEWPEVWTEDLQNLCYQKIKEAVELEIAYARYCLPNGIMGLKADMFVDYVQYLADRRLEFIGLKKIYNSTNPFPWLEEVVDLKEQANFFEGRVTEYQSRPLEF